LELALRTGAFQKLVVQVGRLALKLSRRKRFITTRCPKRCLDTIDARKTELEAEVAQGVRDARTLVAIPVDLARDSTLAFPPDPFGKPASW